MTERRPTLERFLAKLRPAPGGCWEWVGARVPDGYGQLWDGSRLVSAHRWSYEFHVGDVPDGLQLDHLCRNRWCVNPWHLEPVTSGENTRRGRTDLMGAAHQLAKTHCPAGHPYDEANTYVAPRGDRQCRTCMYLRNRSRRLARQAS